MGAAQNYDWHQAMASAVEWWRDAGVDTAISEVPHDWLAPAVDTPPRATPAAKPVAPAPAPRSFAFPATLSAFEAWRLGGDAPDAHWQGDRIGAQGATADGAPDLMIVIEMPERGDIEENRLIAGATGRLFDRMLAAIGRDRQSTYLVPMAVTRPPGGRIPAADLPGLGAALLHQVELAAPARLLIFGNAASRALIGSEVQLARGMIHGVNHAGGKVDAVASYHPRLLLERPAAKLEAWKDLQLLIRGSRT